MVRIGHLQLGYTFIRLEDIRHTSFHLTAENLIKEDLLGSIIVISNLIQCTIGQNTAVWQADCTIFALRYIRTRIESIEFNDYNLLINEENNTIYYSVVDIKNKYNPLIKYKTNKKVNIIINDNITDEKLEENNSLKIMIYNNKEYRIYNLVVTKYPILSIKYEENNKRKIDADIYVFDNYVNSAQRVLKSDGILRIIEENKEYSFSLKKESLGHNTRENHISIFGMEKENEYLIKAVNTINEKERYVQLFINNEYKGIYTFGHNEERRIDNFERNRENNK